MHISCIQAILISINISIAYFLYLGRLYLVDSLLEIARNIFFIQGYSHLT